MAKICILSAPGYWLKTGYYFRVSRDADMLRAAGHDSQVLVIRRGGFLSADEKPISWADGVAMLRRADAVCYENIAPALFSYLRGRSAKRDVLVVHGSLAELEHYSHPMLRTATYRHLLRRGLRRFSQVWSVSDSLTRYLVTYHGGDARRIHLVPNLPTRDFMDRIRDLWAKGTRASVLQDLGLTPERRYICYSGNAQTWQNAPLLVEVFSKLQDRDPSIDLLLLTRDQESFSKLLDHYRVRPDRVIMRTVGNTEVPAYLYSSDLLYLVRDQSEVNEVACPTKGIEYLASGRPLIVSDRLGDISETVRVSGRGIVVGRDVGSDADALCTRILDFLSSESGSDSPPDFDRLELENYIDVFKGLGREA